MKRPKGPELKMPEVQVPGVVRDFYLDLRDRRLLPIIALVVVAIAAVPFLLGDAEEVPYLPPAASGGEELGATQTLRVVTSAPGLRESRERLRDRRAVDPFVQKYTAPDVSGAELNDPRPGEGGSEPAPGPGSDISLPKPGAGAGGGGGSENGGGGGSDGGGKGSQPGVTVVAWAIDVRIVRHGGNSPAVREASKNTKPVVRRRVLPQTVLPGKKRSVVTYLGPAREGTGVTGKALFLVSTEVVSVFGDVRCASGDDVCQLIEVEPGMPVTLVYGANEVRYTLRVDAIKQVTAPSGGRAA